MSKKIDNFIEHLVKLTKSKRGSSILPKFKKSNPTKLFQIGRYIYPYLPTQNESWSNTCFIHTARLFAINPRHTDTKLFGESIRPLIGEYSEEGMNRRFLSFLDATEEASIFQHLGTLIRLSASKRIPINWADLLQGLTHWEADDMWVQNKFSRDFWEQPKTEKEKINSPEMA